MLCNIVPRHVWSSNQVLQITDVDVVTGLMIVHGQLVMVKVVD